MCMCVCIAYACGVERTAYESPVSAPTICIQAWRQVPLCIDGSHQPLTYSLIYYLVEGIEPMASPMK